MVTWQHRRVRVAGLGLHLRRAGPAGAPAVVGLHGLGDDGGCLEEVGELLAPTHDVVLLDARGHGRSDAPAEGYTTDHHVSDVVGVIGALGLHRPVLLGHSMGAITALVLAGRSPGMPGGLVLEDPPAWWARSGIPEQEQLARTRRLQRTVVALQRRTHAELVSLQGEAAPRWSPGALERWAEATQRLAPEVAASLLEQHRSNRSLPWGALLSALACPVLVLHGRPDLGGALGAAEAAALATFSARIEVRYLEGGGHALRHEQPDAYRREVLRFLQHGLTGDAHRRASGREVVF